MKAKLLLLQFLLLAGIASGQVTVDCLNQKITIDASVPIDYEYEIDFKTCRSEKGSTSSLQFDCEIIAPDGYKLSIVKQATPQPKFELSANKNHNGNNVHTGTFIFNKNTEYLITLSKGGSETKVYKIRTKTNWSWTTTFGANSIIFTNRNKFISQKNDDDTFSVVEVQDRKQMDVLPVVMFTFLNNYNGNNTFGISGGLGINFEEIALFAGGSWGIGQNIMITGGVAVNKQVRPNSSYKIGQIIDSAVTNDNLNESQYRFNPFVGISFRLDKNPFAKKEE
ncbi:hypothetical protein MG290_04355 [Flavobacterium sp. CBA20B-1]|uniref:hypothetical protein n=1 Tax=unclassified Flavobacterium TaxID=196869 RepID=UPI0022251E1B|nr:MULTISPECIES: hypothetical protein [unclassified Flavobacterium]WCM42922.1 hypothetical protein MG290_04355 [Flavobacterium sp. CBA20B-1]